MSARCASSVPQAVQRQHITRGPRERGPTTDRLILDGDALRGRRRLDGALIGAIRRGAGAILHTAIPAGRARREGHHASRGSPAGPHIDRKGGRPITGRNCRRRAEAGGDGGGGGRDRDHARESQTPATADEIDTVVGTAVDEVCSAYILSFT